MRLDKFLKVSRLIKRRTVAKEIADNDRVSINGRIAKPSSDISIGDIIEVRMGQKIISTRVLVCDEHANKDDAKSMYEIISETKKDSE